ncbi:hypothetical protein B398_06715 [Xylella fastidiosa 32]|uniref:4-oxalocrotonate tautomerase family protein n=1 Tax=Xylella fastidiosa TaxID=2371 RepID=UPI0003D2C42B|nr:4-oxalocrotonate tautomerase family protein [Xylella fastidiosa]ETE31715.1 hypothetical protein B398_06715 [Xylella fastidiosa 32]
MPHIIVKIAEGRSQPLKQELADRLAATMMDVLGLDSSAVSVAVEDVPMQDCRPKSQPHRTGHHELRRADR